MEKKLTIILMVAVSAVCAVLIGRAVWAKKNQQGVQNYIADLKLHVWPQESQVTMERVKQGQLADETHNAAPLDLKPFFNAKLSESPLWWKGQNSNNLKELPTGEHIYAGVPFDVEGVIQLMGGWLKHYSKTYPAKVENIPVNRRCAKIHLFHGDSYVDSSLAGTVTSKLVVHYADGSTKELEMAIGQQVFDSWYPMYRTALVPAMTNFAPGTELAWAGSNPAIKQYMPEAHLGLFRTTFANPQPDVEITSFDYVSTVTMTCPFLLGVTLE